MTCTRRLADINCLHYWAQELWKRSKHCTARTDLASFLQWLHICKLCKWECFHVFVTWASSQYGEFCWPRFTAVVEFRICMMIPDKIFSWFSLIHYLINYCGSATSAIAECKPAIAQAIFAKNSYTCTTSKITVPKTCCKLHWYSTTYSSFSHKPLGNM